MDEAWPRVLIAPTGSGKTAAVTLGWAAHRLRSPDTTPRRLVWCLPMRALVEQTVDAVRVWFTRLAAEAPTGAAGLPGPEDVHVLMGGVEAGNWVAKPERPAVLVGTQDMLLSRALMRGYAASRANWPMEFALLHDDTQWVFDEVQLMGAGRATSAQLEAFRQRQAARTHRPNGRPARSLWISATLDPAWLETVDHVEPPPRSVVRVAPEAAADSRLAHLAKARKVLRRSDIVPVSSKSDDLKRYVAELAKSILATHRAGRMTLAIVNRVARAQGLAQALHAKIEGWPRNRESPPPALALVHSRFRPADRKREMNKVVDSESKDIIVVATQAIEAGIDISAAVLFTELAPWPSLVQRFGRANRYAELDGGADIHWIDLLAEVNEEKAENELARPYTAEELRAARKRLANLTDAAPANLPPPGDTEPPPRVIRRKDLDDLFDTDPDLTGFDVDVSPYVRDADDTDIRIFWRDLHDGSGVVQVPPRPHADELCAAPIGRARDWLKKKKMRRSRGDNLVFVRDPQWRSAEGAAGKAPPGWRPFRDDPWPGMTLLVDTEAGGYDESIGFTGNPKDLPAPVDGSPDLPSAAASSSDTDEEGHDEDPRSMIGVPVPLTNHLDHVAREAVALCRALDVDAEARESIVRAARWHDLGKAHEVFQDTMRRGLPESDTGAGGLLAKTVATHLRHGRAFFRHELASALAFLHHERWSRDADLVAYLIAAHHGKVRMNLRALPRERAPTGERAGSRFARGVWEGDELPSVDLGSGERWAGGPLTLSIMELGRDEATRESWTERTRDLLERFGPFRLAWMETIVRIADWRASAKEQEGSDGDA